MMVFSLYNLVFHRLGAAAELSESEDNTLTSKTDLSMLSDEGLELSQRQTDTMFQGPSLDEQAEELVIGAILEGRSHAIRELKQRWRRRQRKLQKSNSFR